MDRFIHLLLITLALLGCVDLSAHPNLAGRPAKPVVEYTVADGLSQGNVNDMVQDSVGYLWIATARGLNRFDGANFRQITVKHGLRYNHVSAVLATKNHQIWAGDDHGGLTLIEGMRVTATVDPATDQEPAISDFAETSGRIYVATRGSGIAQLQHSDGRSALQAFASRPSTVEQLVEASAGQLLALSGNRLFLIDVAQPQEPILISAEISAIWNNGDQTLASRNDGVIGQWHHGSFTWQSAPFDLSPNAMTADDAGNVWVATQDQVFQVGSELPAIKVANVDLLLLDREKVLWMASESGLYRYLGARIDHFWLNMDEESPEVFSIIGDARGSMYFGATSGLYRRYPDGELDRLNDYMQIPDGTIRDMVMSADSSGIWTAIEDAGLFLIDDKLKSAQLVPETKGMKLLDLLLAPDGTIWMGTSKNGLLRFQPTDRSLTYFPTHSSVYTLTLHDERWLWFGVDDVGLFRLDINNVNATPELVKSAAQLGRSEFNQLAMEGDAVWIAMNEGGLFYLRDGELLSPGGGPIADQTLYVVESLPDGTIMIGTETGIYQLDPATKDYFHYGQLAGFLGVEANVHATYFDPEGNLWVGTMAGVARIRTNLPMPSIPAPAAEVTSVEAGSDRVLIANGGHVPASQRKVKITFGAVSTRHPDRLEYSYRLLGSDENWSSPDIGKSVSYSNLPAGTYQFQVQARKPAGLVGQPSQWTFTVLTPLWKKTWFLAAIVLAMILATVGLMRYRNRRVALANLRLRKEVADRTRSIEDARSRLEQSNQQLEYQASYDELTGLYNRRSFQDRLKHAWSQPSQPDSCCYLMYLDLDQFKIVNDTCGHAAGDQLLRQVATLIRGKIRTDDTVGRLGGDEFGLVLMHCPVAAAIRVAEAIRLEVENFQFMWDAEVFRIGVSIGVVPIEAIRGDINELQQLADAACYAAKEAGRNQVHLVSDDSDQAQKHRGEMRWVKRLHDAMEHNLFALYEQKIVPLHDSEEPERVEILLRMREPESRKLIPPGAFLPAAERYGLGVKMDEWVVTNLLKSLFVHSGFNARGRRYWVNLSGLSMGDPKFCDTLLALMAKSDLPPGMVNFEITETAVIRNIAEASRLIDALNEMGCEFALDDFGSGLSSFGYLKKLKVDYLKIDGMFVRDIVHDKTDRIFVKSIIDIAHTLNIRTVAEFVEDDEILGVVKSLGADYAQGFGVHRPALLAPNFPPRPIAKPANPPQDNKRKNKRAVS